MSKVQRNALFDAVSATGFPAKDFSFNTIPSFSKEVADEARIRHKPSSSQFQIRVNRDSDSFGCRSQVGDDPWISDDRRMQFGEAYLEVVRWSSAVLDWMDTPDLWKSIPDSVAIPGELVNDSNNTPFASDEQAAISVQLKEISESIKKTCELTAEQSAEIDRKFEEAEKASHRIGRKDWGLLFGGALLSLILSDAITPAIMGDILMMVQHGLGHLFGGPPVGGVLSAGLD